MVSFRDDVSKTMVLNISPDNTQRQVSLLRNELVTLKQDALQTVSSEIYLLFNTAGWADAAVTTVNEAEAGGSQPYALLWLQSEFTASLGNLPRLHLKIRSKHRTDDTVQCQVLTHIATTCWQKRRK